MIELCSAEAVLLVLCACAVLLHTVLHTIRTGGVSSGFYVFGLALIDELKSIIYPTVLYTSVVSVQCFMSL